MSNMAFDVATQIESYNTIQHKILETLIVSVTEKQEVKWDSLIEHLAKVSRTLSAQTSIRNAPETFSGHKLRFNAFFTWTLEKIKVH